MNSLRSSVWLRTLLCDTTADFQAINSTELPDGATLFNRQDETLWRLYKNFGPALDVALENNVLQKPNDGTRARWLAVEVNGGSPYQFQGYLVTPIAITMTSNQWNQLGSTAGTFAANSGSGSGIFTQSPTTGLITYHGPPRTLLVTMRASLNNGIGATSIAVHACISLNGDVVDAGTANYPEFGEQANNIINELHEISVSRVVQITDGETLQLMLRNATNADDLVATYYQVTVAPL